MLSGACAGAVPVMIKMGIGGAAPPTTAAAISVTFGTLAFVVVEARGLRTLVHEYPRKYQASMLASGGTSGVAQLLYYIAISILSPVTVGAITSLNPLWTLLLAHVLLRRWEKVTRRVALGAFAVVAGVILVAIGPGIG